MLHLPSKIGFIVDSKLNIESLTYGEYLTTYGSDETTTRNGVAPRLYVDGKKIMTWGVRGNNHAIYQVCKNNREAKKALLEIWENNIENECNAPRFFSTKTELYADLAESLDRNLAVIKRYFRLVNALAKKQAVRLAEEKKALESKKLVDKKQILLFIENNKEFVQREIAELKELKSQGRQHEWHVKANALVQKASGNDFRALKWKDIYSIIINS